MYEAAVWLFGWQKRNSEVKSSEGSFSARPGNASCTAVWGVSHGRKTGDCMESSLTEESLLGQKTLTRLQAPPWALAVVQFTLPILSAIFVLVFSALS